MANLTSLPLPDEPDSPERMYTRSEVVALLAAADRAWRDVPRAEDAGPSLPAPRHGLTLLQGGAA